MRRAPLAGRLRSLFSRDLLILCVVAGFGALLYANTLGHPLVWDDHSFVENQPFVQDCSSLLRLVHPKYYLGQSLPAAGAARPVWLGSVVADACLHGGVPAGYHITSLLWHLLAAALLMVLAWELARDPLAALAAGALFVAHPLHTENVNVVTFRADILAVVFMLLSLLFYLYRRGRTGWRRIACLAAAVASFILALLAKEMAAVLPFLVLLCDRLFPEAPRRAARARAWRVYAVLAAALLAYLCFRMPRSGYTVLGHQDLFSSLRDRAGMAAGPQTPAFSHKPIAVPWQAVYESPKVRFLSMAGIAGDYLRLLLWPHPLQGDYAPRPVRDWLSVKPILSVLAWLTLLALAWTLRRRSPLAAFGLFWTPIALLPVSGLWLLLNPQAERYLYVPSAGIALAGAAALAGLARSRRIPGARTVAVVVAGAVLALYSLGTAARNLDYRDDAAFFAATVAVDPGVARARFNLAQSLHGQGRAAGAEAEYREALRLWPEFAGWRTAFALLLIDQGRLAEATQELQAALRQQPEEPAAHYFLGAALWRAGRLAAAQAQFEETLRLDPRDLAAAEARRFVKESRQRGARRGPYLDSPAACSAAVYEQSRLMLSMPCSPAADR
ncbi:MAG: tetratricopeptide repeat protein [Elusimicrobia bacterium]|nr:tetratricopeptide repeat protein [Elusimicrobiota bacterium]